MASERLDRAVPWRDDDATVGDPDALLLPAFADPHVHLVAAAADRAGLDLATDPPANVGELLDRLRARARDLPPGAWLRASGYDEAWLAERRHPTLDELDAAVGDRPLRMRHATRHATLLNRVALTRVESALGPLAATHAPRDERGRATGIVYGLEPEITRVVGPLAAGELERLLAELGRALARAGVLHVDEITASNDASRVARLAAAVGSGALPQRVRAFVGDPDEAEPARRASNGLVAIAGVKLLARSTDEVQSRAFVDRLVRARRLGLPVAVHAVEADVVDAVLTALAVAPPRRVVDVGRDVPDRLEHVAMCPPDLVRRIAAAGVAVVTQPGFVAARGDKYLREVEPPLWPWLYPIRALRAAGVLVASGSDAPVAPLDPRLGVDAAIRRATRGGATLAPSEGVGEAAALDLCTAAPARLRGDGAAYGVAPGARADLLVVEPESWSRRWAGLALRHVLRGGEVIA